MLSNTPVANPLDEQERTAVFEELFELSQGFAEEPVSDEAEMTAEEQSFIALDFIARSLRAARAVQEDEVGFEELVHIITVLELHGESSDKTYDRLLKTSSAKLEEAREVALPLRRAEHKLRVEETIHEDGYYLQHVLGRGEPAPLPPFSYSVGLWPEAPELVLVGLDPQLAHVVLSSIAKRVASGERLHQGERLEDALGEGLPVLVEEAPAGLLANLNLAAEGREAFQLVWCDEDGLLPGDAAFDDEVLSYQDYPLIP